MLAKQRIWIVALALLVTIVLAGLSWAARFDSVLPTTEAAAETATPTETPEPPTLRLPDFLLTAVPVTPGTPNIGPYKPPPNILTPGWTWTMTPQPVTATPPR